jgi:hypothetical protein
MLLGHSLNPVTTTSLVSLGRLIWLTSTSKDIQRARRLRASWRSNLSTLFDGCSNKRAPAPRERAAEPAAEEAPLEDFN